MNQQNDLPNGWVIGILEDVLDYIQPTEYIVKSTDYSDNYKIPVLTAGKSFVLGYTNEDFGIFTKLPAIIFDDFTTAIKWVNFPFKVKSSAMKILVPSHSDVNMKFVYYFMETLRINTDTHKRYWISVGAKLPIPLPPLPEQHRIVAKIEELFSRLDKGIESLKTAQQQLKTYRQAVLKWAFEGKLTRPHHDSSDFRDEHDSAITNNQGHHANHKNQGADRLPEGWVAERIGSLTLLNPKLPFENIDDDLEVSFLPMKYVEEAINKINLIEFRKYRDVKKGFTPMTDGDVIFAKITPCMENGKIAIVHSLKNKIAFGSTEFHVFRCKEKLLNSYLFYFLIQERTRQEAERNMTGAVGQRRVPKKFLEDLLIPLPPTLSEQHHIVSEIEKRLSVADKLEDAIATALQQAEALRQSILKKAFEGKLLSEAELQACRNDPHWEPASVLLERIRKEREAQKLADPSKKSRPSKNPKNQGSDNG